MKRFISFALAVFAAVAVFGQAPSDTARVYFEVSHWQFDPALGDNAASMDAFVERLRQARADGNVERVVVRGYASPDGNDRFNQRLSAKRSEEIAGIIARRAGLSSALIETEPMGVAWDDLRSLVAVTPDVPSRDEILNIIDNTPVWIFDAHGRIIDGRKKRLMDLRGGRPYRWMLANIFPKVRCAVAISLWLRDECAESARRDAQLADNQTGGGHNLN